MSVTELEKSIAMKNSLEYAQECDKNDPLRRLRSDFFIPKINGKDAVYLTGNSLGLQPKSAKMAISQELDDWATYGVEGHFEAKNPWFAYHEMFLEPVAKLVGAQPNEVGVMNTLTTNLHLLMTSFYRPKDRRYKIICEAKAFPSDQYALETQVRLHGYDPDKAIIEISPRSGEHTINNEDILTAIKDAGDELALVMIGGVNYYTGQVFEMKKITDAGHAVGAIVGFDLAHAVGNILLELHDWKVDFAVWCSYKYLNSGPGSVSGYYIHESHCKNRDLPRFGGWWGHEKETRFLMEKGFVPMNTAEAWQLSNAPVFSMAIHKASLDVFSEVGMVALRRKAVLLTNYLEFIINQISASADGIGFEIITPKEIEHRGCQLSILAHGQGKELFDKLTRSGVIADWREPNVIRIAPVPLYNSFEDVFNFGEKLSNSLT